MTMLTLSQAAVAVGLDKSTIRRSVKAGRISGTRDAFGVWQVDAAELHRVYPPASERSGGDPGGTNSHAVPESASADALVAELRAMLADLRQERDAAIADLRRDRDQWRDQAQRLALPRPAEAPQTWWRWLRTTA